MEEVTPLMLDVAKYLQNQIKAQLTVKRPSMTYAGVPKPVSGRYPTPNSAPRASGTLYNSVRVVWVEGFSDENPQEPVLAVDFGDADEYAYFIDQGRRPNSGKSNQGIMRPRLKSWAAIKPLPQFRDRYGKFISHEQRAIMITRSVAKYGYKGTNFIDKAIEASIDKIAQDLSKAAEEFLLNYLDKNKTIIPL